MITAVFAFLVGTLIGLLLVVVFSESHATVDRWVGGVDARAEKPRRHLRVVGK